jgi:hypothetical protein
VKRHALEVAPRGDVHPQLQLAMALASIIWAKSQCPSLFRVNASLGFLVLC